MHRGHSNGKARRLGLSVWIGAAVGCFAVAIPLATNSSEAQTLEGATAAVATAQAPVAPEDYVIGPLDKLSVKVFKVPDLSSDAVLVDASGEIELPLIGSIQAAGKTSEALAKDIADRLGSTYLQSPQVSVFVEDFASRKVTVEGEVKTAGVFQMKGQISLLQAIAMAGGMGDAANGHHVAVIRQTGGLRHVSIYDYERIRTGHEADPEIKGDDIVIVDASMSRKTFAQILQTTPLLSLLAIMR